MKKIIITGLIILAVVAVVGYIADKVIPKKQTAIKQVEIDEDKLPPVVGKDPSYKVGLFYYPWYGNPEFNDEWVHWGKKVKFEPPKDVTSDYFPTLGAYSSTDPEVVAQHFAWLRESNVGVAISSWWGQGSYEDRAVPVLLEQAERYKIKVAFHIEPYGGRSPKSLVKDIKYIYHKYGDHPAFFKLKETSRFSKEKKLKGVFFVWAVSLAQGGEYWQKAMDEIHNLPDGAIVIAHTDDRKWSEEAHFDGVYNYATLNTKEDDFSWSKDLPSDAWYVPSVLPGFLERRNLSPGEERVVTRDGGKTYDNQWKLALSTGVEPKMVTITSFNEWHEGTQIEPAKENAKSGRGFTYEDYGSLGPKGYLILTKKWVGKFLNK
jgi:hypothetical protein